MSSTVSTQFSQPVEHQFANSVSQPTLKIAASWAEITQVTSYLTLGLGLINAVGYLLLFKSPAYGVQFSKGMPGTGT